ncbi:MAG: sensor histidine kinase [Acidobacteriota bacterium]
MALWAEPRPNAPPGPGFPERLFAVLAAAVLVADPLLRTGQIWRPFAVGLGLVIAALLYVRNRYPLASFSIAFGIAFAVEIASEVLAAGWQAPPSYTLALLLPYALCRWGAGWEAVLGVGVLLASFGLAAVLGDLHTPQAAISGAFMLLFPAAFGATLRFREQSEERAAEQVRSAERERLARELHDTVAHHVSAIAIQAQAGRAVADGNPTQALATLGVIEGAAKRTLEEMRDIVGALRDGGGPELAPQKGLADLPELVARSGAQLDVVGDLDGLRPAAGTAIYRMVQEAITNAERHGTNRTGIWVRLLGDRETVSLRVLDDGDGVLAAGQPGARGFGLLGLAERAALLGGHFEAGPGPEGGWRVEATLPRSPSGGS